MCSCCVGPYYCFLLISVDEHPFLLSSVWGNNIAPSLWATFGPWSHRIKPLELEDFCLCPGWDCEASNTIATATSTSSSSPTFPAVALVQLPAHGGSIEQWRQHRCSLQLPSPCSVCSWLEAAPALQPGRSDSSVDTAPSCLVSAWAKPCTADMLPKPAGSYHHSLLKVASP